MMSRKAGTRMSRISLRVSLSDSCFWIIQDLQFVRNFRLGSLACASYPSPALGTTNLPPERAPASKRVLLGNVGLHVVGGKLRERIRRGLFKSREPAAKHKLHHVRRAISLLGDPKFRFFSLFRRCARFEKMRPVDEHHHVGILFDGA